MHWQGPARVGRLVKFERQSPFKEQQVKHPVREQTKKPAKALGKHYVVPAIKRSFDVIDLLAQRSTGMTVSEIHRALHLPLSSAAAILYTLQILGYIDKDPKSARYVLGLKLYSFSRRLVDQLGLPGRCHDLLEQLAAETGFTSHIAVMRDGESMYVDRVPGSGLIQFSSYVGMRWALHASGVGKALLAFLSEEELAQTLKYLPLTKITPYTITLRSQLEKQLQQFRRCGYAWEISEGEEGVACVAAAIIGPEGTVPAAISVSGSTHQISEERIADVGAVVKKYADLMSARLGSIVE
jgi:IclR family transcriptional regulator, KDG regulon repressor